MQGKATLGAAFLGDGVLPELPSVEPERGSSCPTLAVSGAAALTLTVYRDDRLCTLPVPPEMLRVTGGS